MKDSKDDRERPAPRESGRNAADLLLWILSGLAVVAVLGAAIWAILTL